MTTDRDFRRHARAWAAALLAGALIWAAGIYGVWVAVRGLA